MSNNNQVRDLQVYIDYIHWNRTFDIKAYVPFFEPGAILIKHLK